jgi:putative CRISPR-associated protein (TIGR02619 family)
MSRTIICTTGTSIAQGTASLRSLQSKSSHWEDDSPELVEEIARRLEGLDLGSLEGRAKVSAEINSLARLEVGEGDRVVLLVTDTADGRICAEAVRRVLVKSFGLPENDVRLECVRGLQVRDAVTLRQQGLPNFVEHAMRWVGDPQIRYGGEVILNPTGGFKGVVPFLTVLGMLFGLRTVYIFEHCDALISLPPLPVTFDLHLYERALPGLERIHAAGAISEEEFFAAIEDFHPSERDLFNTFVERDGKMVTLSALGFALVGMEDMGTRNVRILPEVKAKWQAADPVYKTRMERYLIRCGYPLWRTIHGHHFVGTQLKVFGERSGPRIAGIENSDGFFITSYHDIDAGEHRAYEQAISGRKPEDYPLSEFVEWEPPSDLKATNDRLLRAEESRLEELTAENQRLRNQLRDAGQPYRDEIKRWKTEASSVRGLRADLAKERMTVNFLRADNTALHLKLAALERTTAGDAGMKNP